MSKSCSNPFEALPDGLPAGNVVTSRETGQPLVWVSDDAGPQVQHHWHRLFADHSRTGLYPLLLEGRLDVCAMLATPATFEQIDMTPRDLLIREYCEYFGDDWPGFTAPEWLEVNPGGEARRRRAPGARRQCPRG